MDLATVNQFWRNLFNKTLWYFLNLNILSNFINVFRGTALILVLSPTTYGIWTVINSIAGLGKFSTLGIAQYFYFRGKTKYSIQIFLKHIPSMITFLSIPISLVISCVTINYLSSLNIRLKLDESFLIFMLPLVISIRSIYLTKLKLERSVTSISNFELICSILLLFQVLLGWLYGLVGVLLAACSIFIPVFLYEIKTKYPRINMHSTKKLLIHIPPALFVAIPLIAFTILKSTDVWLSGWFMGVAWSGYLGIYITFSGLVALPASIISTYFFTLHVREFHGQSDYTIKVSILNLLISLPVAYVGITLFEYLTTYYLNDYIPASNLLNEVWWTIPLLTLRNIISNFLFANRFYYFELFLVSLTLVLKVVLWNILEVEQVIQISNIFYGLGTAFLLMLASKMVAKGKNL